VGGFGGLLVRIGKAWCIDADAGYAKGPIGGTGYRYCFLLRGASASLAEVDPARGDAEGCEHGACELEAGVGSGGIGRGNENVLGLLALASAEGEGYVDIGIGAGGDFHGADSGGGTAAGADTSDLEWLIAGVLDLEAVPDGGPLPDGPEFMRLFRQNNTRLREYREREKGENEYGGGYGFHKGVLSGVDHFTQRFLWQHNKPAINHAPRTSSHLPCFQPPRQTQLAIRDPAPLIVLCLDVTPCATDKGYRIVDADGYDHARSHGTNRQLHYYAKGDS
jgi:hypothetical protein